LRGECDGCGKSIRVDATKSRPLWHLCGPCARELGRRLVEVCRTFVRRLGRFPPPATAADVEKARAALMGDK
jgi:hypothetical protein